MSYEHYTTLVKNLEWARSEDDDDGSAAQDNLKCLMAQQAQK